jgi:hypothetical protein
MILKPSESLPLLEPGRYQFAAIFSKTNASLFHIPQAWERYQPWRLPWQAEHPRFSSRETDA